MKNIYIVEFPSNLGLREPQPGVEPGVKHLPEWLRTHHFHEYINANSCVSLAAPDYQCIKDVEAGVLNADLIVDYAVEQAVVLSDLFDKELFPVVLGGDCSILIGAAIALKQHGNYGLVYFDGHTDFMDTALSHTAAAAGMAASIVTGKGYQKLTNILNKKPYIRQQNLWCIGNREYDAEYENEIINSEATYISLALLRRSGVEACIDSVIANIEQKQLDGFWLHIDVDILNDGIMPCVDSRTADGLHYHEFNRMIYPLLASDKLKGLEITILDPTLDPTGSFTNEFILNFTGTFNKAMSDTSLGQKV